MKVIGIDYGEARIGVAASDDIGMMAHPVKTIKIDEEGSPADAIPEVVTIVQKNAAEVVVVGLPLALDGSKGPAADGVEAWVDQLTEALPEQQIEMVDERLSTAVAQRKLAEAGKSTKKSRNVIDQVAAVEILQTYLEAQQESALDSIGKPGGDPDMAAFRDDDDDDFGDLDGYGGGGGGGWGEGDSHGDGDDF